MKSVARHLDECLEAAKPLPPFDVELSDAFSCILAEDVRSTVDVPVADLAARDGYAVAASDTLGAADDPVRMHVVADIYADSMETVRHVEGTAVRIASGARMPGGANAVVPLEKTDQGTAEVLISVSVRSGDNVRQQAEDLAAGEVILERGTRISARHIALLAAAGRSRVTVRPAPRVVVMSVGDELVEPGRPLSPGKVYDADSHALATAVRAAGAVVYRVSAVSDEKRTLRDALEDQLVRADVIITTGGLSYGGGDTVKEVLSPLGSVRFDNVAMSPGRQMGVGTVGDGTLIFCLPGDPVVALVAFEVFVRPALRKMAGYTHLNTRMIGARAARGLVSDAGLQDYVPVKVTGGPADGYEFSPTGESRHPLLNGLASANGLAVVPADQTTVAIGDTLECMILNG
ncbi:gephyrin-like molybdotransferase Glp [Actinobaculum sp. 352]|uniref:molybdopterin molybdotransferase MoeA n=1 Tax=Actinobaculum sp. 352 TaxID=2490946 RepID=UPI000F7EB1E6|nr:gephyrin-like molybdotransferase Glp [Actinobaculum sp. 352]RTE49306.1 molybdopterin molybdenumtransferase MoeA [Actinobaculum sp. 352]